MGFAATLTLNGIYKIINTGVVFLISILLSKLTGPEGFGLLSFLIVNVALINLITSFGSDAAITYKIASNEFDINKTESFIYFLVLLQLLLLAIFELVHYSLKNEFWLFSMDSLKWSWVGIAFFISISFVEKYTALLNGCHLYSICNKTILSINFLLLALLLYLTYYVIVVDISIYILIYICSNVFQALALIILFHYHFNTKFKILKLKKFEVLSFVSYAGIAFLSNLIQFISYRIDFWLIDYYRNQTELGFYALAVRFVQLFWILPMLFASIIFPKVSASRQKLNLQNINSLIKLMNFANIIIGLISFLIAPWIFNLIYDESFSRSIFLFQILLPGVILFCITTILAAYFAGIGQLKKNLYGSIICTTVILFLDMVLIPSYGSIGAAIASSIGYTITTIYFILIYCNISKTPLASLLIPTIKDRKQIVSLLSSLKK